MFYGIIADIVIGTVSNNKELSLYILIAILFAASLYILSMSIIKGIWDRHIKPSIKNNIIISLIAAVIYTIMCAKRYAVNMSSVGLNPYTSNSYYIITALSSLFMFGITHAILSVLRSVYNKRRQKLDAESEDQ